jgi:hypothetical protein
MNRTQARGIGIEGNGLFLSGSPIARTQAVEERRPVVLHHLVIQEQPGQFQLRRG